jgi:hypothetical protein
MRLINPITNLNPVSVTNTRDSIKADSGDQCGLSASSQHCVNVNFVDFFKLCHAFRDINWNWLHFYKGSHLLEQLDHNRNFITSLQLDYNSFLVKSGPENFFFICELEVWFVHCTVHCARCLLYIFGNIYIHYYPCGYFWTPCSSLEVLGHWKVTIEVLTERSHVSVIWFWWFRLVYWWYHSTITEWNGVGHVVPI